MESIKEKYLKSRIEENKKKLEENSSLIHNFISLCKTKGIELNLDNFEYIPTIGIVANYPNIVAILNNKIKTDKEELVTLDIIEQEFTTAMMLNGYYISENYMTMAHPYFRRSYSPKNNFSPHFIDNFCTYSKPNNQKYIALDFDRVRINVDGRFYLELDTWYGASFNKKISDIEDGVVKLRPYSLLEEFLIEFYFNDAYSLDIKWSSYNGIKEFQAEEFKTENVKINKDGIEYYPVRYVHAEFDNSINAFRHFDGAIHFYTEEEYYSRRDQDFNYNNKNDVQIKTLSQKLFKINGHIEVDDWTNLVSHFFTGNPLIIEYFEGKNPDHIQEVINIVNRENNID